MPDVDLDLSCGKDGRPKRSFRMRGLKTFRHVHLWRYVPSWQHVGQWARQQHLEMSGRKRRKMSSFFCRRCLSISGTRATNIKCSSAQSLVILQSMDIRAFSKIMLEISNMEKCHVESTCAHSQKRIIWQFPIWSCPTWVSVSVASRKRERKST